MTETGQGALPVWHDEGRRVASALDAVGSALVVGRDAELAAWVALGIARAQAERRRVAVADLVGEVAPLRALTRDDDDPHGISDSFLYGVSLNRIARPADAQGNLFVLPSGSEAVATEEIFRSDRWRRLAGGFREVDALLLLVAHADTPGLDALAASVDGIVLAGDAAGALPDAPAPLAVVGAPTRRARAVAERTTPNDAAAAATTSAAAAEPRAPRRQRRGDADAIAGGPVAAPPTPNRRAAYVVAALAALALLAALVLFARQRAAGGTGPRMALGADSARGVSTDSARAAAAPDTLPMQQVTNAADTAARAMWTVQLGSSQSDGESFLPPGVDRATLPPLVVAPELGEGLWYKTYVGAYARREQAESLRASLAARRVVGEGSGMVTRTPFALLLADSVRAADAPQRIRALASRGVRAYPLARGDGLVALYAGAFDTQDKAAYLARALDSAGVPARLVYRFGRSL